MLVARTFALFSTGALCAVAVLWQAPWGSRARHDSPAMFGRVLGATEESTVASTRRLQWGIVFPFHGDRASRRNLLTNASWYSLCRAMRAARKHSDFHVLVIDDRNYDNNDVAVETASEVHEIKQGHRWSDPWSVKCAKSLVSVTRLEGRHDININMQDGYRWASHFDLTLNIGAAGCRFGLGMHILIMRARR